MDERLNQPLRGSSWVPLPSSLVGTVNRPGVERASAPPVDAAYVIGADGGEAHALRRGAVLCARDLAPNAKTPTVIAECGAVASFIAGWGAFDAENRILREARCHTCAWTVAIARCDLQAELGRLEPQGEERDRLERAEVDPTMLARICRGIIASTEEREGQPAPAHELDDPEFAHLLGHVSAHAPVPIRPMECWEGGCDHEPRGRGLCPTKAVLCRACSFTSGGDAGEWAGTFPGYCNVSVPCSVLQAAAATYEVALDSNVAEGGGASGA